MSDSEPEPKGEQAFACGLWRGPWAGQMKRCVAPSHPRPRAVAWGGGLGSRSRVDFAEQARAEAATMAWGQLCPSKLPAPFSAAGPGAGCPHEQAAAATTGRAHCAHMAHMITMTLSSPTRPWKWDTECASGRRC